METARPKFIYPPGSVLMHPPLRQQHARLYAFLVKGELPKLQGFVGRVEFLPSLRFRLGFPSWPSSPYGPSILDAER